MRCNALKLLLLLAFFPLLGCGQSQPPAEPKPPEVLVSQPVLKEVTDYEEFTGRTQAVATITIRARVTGYLEKVNFKEGAEVKQGDLLFEIDPRPYKAQLDQDLANLTNQKAIVVKTEALYKRSMSLVRSGASSHEDVENQRADWEVAKAAVGQAEAKVRASQLNLDWTKVTSPISGRISRQLIDPGNLVMADQTALTTIVSQDPIYVFFDVDERTVLHLRRMLREGKIKSYREADLPVYVGLADEDTFDIKGKIDFVDNQIDIQTGTLRVRGIFDNPQRLLSPGLFVRVRVPIGLPHQALLVSEKALGTDQGQKFLYVVNDQDEVVYRKVKIGSLHDSLRVIESGLKPGERVIVSGLQRVRPGVKVEPKPVDMTSQAAAPSRPALVASAK